MQAIILQDLHCLQRSYHNVDHVCITLYHHTSGGSRIYERGGNQFIESTWRAKRAENFVWPRPHSFAKVYFRVYLTTYSPRKPV